MLTGIFSMTVLKWRTSAASRHPTNLVDQKKARAWVRNDPLFCLWSLDVTHKSLHYCPLQRPEGWSDSTGPHDAQSITEVEGRASPVWGQHIVMFSRRSPSPSSPPSSYSYSSMPSTPREKDEERSLQRNVRTVMPEAVSLPKNKPFFLNIFHKK